MGAYGMTDASRSTGGDTGRPGQSRHPVLLVVGADQHDVTTTATALERRYGADYRVATAGPPATPLADLAAMAGRGEQVALLAADLHLPDGDGVDLLAEATCLHP